MYPKFQNITTRKQQSGAVLLISLVMLLLLTIIGVSSVDDMTLQSNMTRNSQFKMQAHNTAYSESNAHFLDLVQVFEDTQQIDLLQEVQTTTTKVFDPSGLHMASASNPFKQTLSINYTGAAGALVTRNVSQMMEAGAYEVQRFEYNSVAWLPNSGTRSDQLQGISYPAPKDESRTGDQKQATSGP